MDTLRAKIILLFSLHNFELIHAIQLQDCSSNFSYCSENCPEILAFKADLATSGLSQFTKKILHDEIERRKCGKKYMETYCCESQHSNLIEAHGFQMDQCGQLTDRDELKIVNGTLVPALGDRKKRKNQVWPNKHSICL